MLPIGRDPDSGLFEFVHLYSGSLPARGHDGQLAYEDDAAIVFVLIPGGVYSMGAQNSDEDLPNFDESAQPDEGPVRIVNIAPFFLAKHECTQAQWRRLTEGGEPSRFQPRDHFEGVSLRNPVETVSCVEVEATLERFGLRLPSEAEWEYSCRAGTSYQSFWSGGDERALAKAAWFSGNAGKQTHRVGTRAPNPWGLFDTHGNVGEWCADHYGSYVEAPTSGVARRIAWDAGPGHALRVVRGGWWNLSAGEARSARRRYDKAHFLSHFVGFRPTRSIEQSSPPRAEGTSER